MQGIYNYIPETNHVSRVCVFAVVLYLQFVLHVILLLPLNIFCTCTLSLSVIYVQCPIWLFFMSLISCFPGVLLRYCMSDFELVPVAPTFTGLYYYYYYYYYAGSILDLSDQALNQGYRHIVTGR